MKSAIIRTMCWRFRVQRWFAVTAVSIATSRQQNIIHDNQKTSLATRLHHSTVCYETVHQLGKCLRKNLICDLPTVLLYSTHDLGPEILQVSGQWRRSNCANGEVQKSKITLTVMWCCDVCVMWCCDVWVMYTVLYTTDTTHSSQQGSIPLYCTV
jgi:hypothetical protein